MTKQTWAERLTPFTGGAAIAVLIVALVVQPTWGQTGTVNTCIQCLAYYEYRCTQLEHCGPTPSSGGQQALYMWRACMDKCKSDNCAGPGKPCPGKDIPESLRDCGSTACNMYRDIPRVSVCDWDCWNRPCSSVLTGNSCLDKPKSKRDKGCGDALITPDCWECMCTQ